MSNTLHITSYIFFHNTYVHDCTWPNFIGDFLWMSMAAAIWIGYTLCTPWTPKVSSKNEWRAVSTASEVMLAEILSVGLFNLVRPGKNHLVKRRTGMDPADFRRVSVPMLLLLSSPKLSFCWSTLQLDLPNTWEYWSTCSQRSNEAMIKICVKCMYILYIIYILLYYIILYYIYIYCI